MDGVADGHRRRKSSSIGNGIGREDTLSTKRGSLRRNGRKHRSQENANQKHQDSSDDSHFSSFSSPSTSDDVEMNHLSADEGSTNDEETGLTKGDRKRRRRRIEKNTLMDERVAGEVRMPLSNRMSADISVIRRSLVNVVLIGLWYLFSLSLSIYNKWMFGEGELNFPFPLFTTCMHMLVQFLFASLVLFLFPRFRPRADSISNPQNHSPSSLDPTQPGKPLMTRMFYITRIGPCGAATGLDIGLGNMSLKFVTLTFYTMCKSSALGFVLIFAFVFRLESPSVKLILIIVTMTIGVIMMVAGEAAFDALGFVLVITSAFFSGFRWALTQILLLRNPATSNPFSSIFFLAPIMFLSLACIAFPIEGFVPLMHGLTALTTDEGVAKGLGILLFPGTLAFLMTASEFALLQRTSVVTLSICGIFKEVVTISAAGITFNDKLTPVNLGGLFVTISSIAAYNYIKITKMRKDAREKVGNETEEAAEPMLAGEDGMGVAEGTSVPTLSSTPTAARDTEVSDTPARASPVKRPEDHE